MDPSRLESRSKLPCLFIICIFRTLSAKESVLVIVTFSSPDSLGLEAFPFEVEAPVGGRLSVNVASSALLSNEAVWRLLGGSCRLTTTSSTGLGNCLVASSRSGVDDHDEGLCRSLMGAVTSITAFSLDDKFCVDVQLRTDLSSVSRFRLGVDDAMSSPRRAPCSL
jgi:hypothetical protein